MIEIKFFDEKPSDWPTTGNWWPDYFVKSLQEAWPDHSLNMMTYWMLKPEGVGNKTIRYHVWNNAPGAPTYVIYAGSGHAWDGSSNFNFNKEMVRRYRGEEPVDVFQKPEISAEAAKIVDSNFSFLWFL